MQGIIIILFLVVMIVLVREQRCLRKKRAKLTHIIHVNGIRGKSTTVRLIDAGLRAGGWKVFSKTTGTEPMMIDVDGQAHLIHRRGRANIKEQIQMIFRAADQNAQVLVLECMAVAPELQKISQEKIVQADIGVITNVRLDHTAEMGPTLEDICDSLSNTIPEKGILFTADQNFYPQLQTNARMRECKAELILPDGSEPEFDFPENVALAAAVCQHLGVSRETAIEGMRQYQRDPYALSVHRLKNGCVFVNGMSVNDPQSTTGIYHRLVEKYGWENRPMILVVNNRADRGYRTQHMIDVARQLRPETVWLFGAAQSLVAGHIKRSLPNVRICRFRHAKELDFAQMPPEALVFAVGNIAGPGRELMRRVREESEDVS